MTVGREHGAAWVDGLWCDNVVQHRCSIGGAVVAVGACCYCRSIELADVSALEIAHTYATAAVAQTDIANITALSSNADAVASAAAASAAAAVAVSMVMCQGFDCQCWRV